MFVLYTSKSRFLISFPSIYVYVPSLKCIFTLNDIHSSTFHIASLVTQLLFNLKVILKHDCNIECSLAKFVINPFYITKKCQTNICWFNIFLFILISFIQPPFVCRSACIDNRTSKIAHRNKPK